MNKGTLSAADTSNLYAGWQPDGLFQGVFSGKFRDRFDDQSSAGIYWSSTVDGGGFGTIFQFSSSHVYPGNADSSRLYGFAVRCSLDV
jgi:hypothetical protein